MNAQSENTRLPKVCIVGAGCSGFTTAKRLKDYGIPFDCYEMSDDIGGNWYDLLPHESAFIS
jgi:cation diffusion facilitator CzcD-associated flavoprotein CzcO